MRTKLKRSGNSPPTRSESQNFISSLREKSAIRETLRQWEAENPQPNDYIIQGALGPGEVANQMFKADALSGMREGRQLEAADDGVVTDETGAVESLAAAPTDHLHPGTLIELR